jgi:hypothetical protein
MTVQFNYGCGQLTATFNAKPSAEVRGILKRNGFRWSPSGGYWWRRKVTGSADIETAVRRQLDKEAGIRRPDGQCWECQSADGYFRSQGAATPVLCDSCHEKRNAPQADYFDMMVEDNYRDACGL